MIRLISLKAAQFKQLQDIDLRFPPSGSILIEGRNEAGKSTLFEAIFFALFGKPLLQGTNAEDLIGYQSTEAIVQLELSIESGSLAIERKVKRSKSRAGSEARLRVMDKDGVQQEEVKGATAVNQRLEQELKLEADAFLNSCFVEQKKLEKLEGMNARDRETSLMRLLNMDRMLDEERRLRITVDDSRQLQRLEQRVRLAEAQAEMPAVAKEGLKTRRQLNIISAKDSLAEIARCNTAISDANKRLDALKAPVAELEERVSRIETVHAASTAAEIIQVRIDALQRQSTEISGLREQLSRLENSVSVQIPALYNRLRRANRLLSRVSRLSALGAEADAAALETRSFQRSVSEAASAQQRADELAERISKLTARITALEEEEQNLSALERGAGLRQALEDWLAAISARDGVETISRQTKKAEEIVTNAGSDLASVMADTARLRTASRNALWLTVVFALGAVILLLASLLQPRAVIAAAVLGASALPQFVRYLRATSRWRAGTAEERHRSDALREAENALVRLEGQMENAKATSGAASGRLEMAALRFDSMGEQAPDTSDECRARLAALPSEAEPFEPSRLRTVRSELAQAQGSRDEMQKALEATLTSVSSANVPLLNSQIARLEQWSARVRTGIVEPWWEAACASAEALGIESGEDLRESITRTIASLTTQIRIGEQAVAERPALEKRIAEIAESSQREGQEISNAWPSVATAIPDASVPETPEQAAGLRSEIDSILLQLNEAATRADLRARQQERNTALTDLSVSQRHLKDAELALRKQTDVLQYPSDAPLEPVEIADTIEGWSDADPADRVQLEERFEDLKERHAGLKARSREIASDLGLDPAKDHLVLDKERAQLTDVARDHGVREKAINILKAARERIMGKVMPYTIEHMRSILPTLTMDRYHDAKLTPDYKIEVWDERANTWKSKNIFSGGTRDQFSLALRLAFAVATLPQERGAAPAFIFLDEPLSSFDTERSEALMYLLTKGEIADTFDQILVISHSQTIAADDFQYRLRMEAGRVEEAPEEMRAVPEQAELEVGVGG